MRRNGFLMNAMGSFSMVLLGAFVTSDALLAQQPAAPDRSSDGDPRDGRGGPGVPGARGPGGTSSRGGFGRGGSPFGGEPNFSSEMRRNEAFAEKLSLTEEQKKTLSDIDMERMTYFRSMPRGGGAPGGEDFEKRMQDIQAKMKEFDLKATNVLTDEQKSVWESRKTELKAEFAEREAARGDQGDGRARPEGTTTTSTPSMPERRTTFTDEKPPEGATTTASFGRPASTDSASREAGSSGGGADQDGGARLSFNFRYAPWADVLKLFAEAANLTLDLNDVPPGTFNYFDDKSYTATEALDVLNGYLLPKGYVLVRRDRFLVSLNIDNGIPPNLIPNVTVEDLSTRGANELLSVVIPLEGLEADKIVGEVKELLGPQGKVSALKNTNSLVVMDTGSNLSRVVRLLKLGTPIDNRETAFRAVPLQHISAAEAERTVRRLFGLNPVVTVAAAPQPQFGFSPFGGFGGYGSYDRSRDPRSGGDDRSRDYGRSQPTSSGGSSATTPSQFAGKIQVTADTRTNHLLITASAALVKVVEDVVKSIDVDKDASGKMVVANDSPSFLKAYSVPGGDPTQVSRTLNAIMPGLVVGEDTKAGKIHVQGTREEHTEIERLIQTLAGEAGGSVIVINLTRTDPLQVANTLRNLFTNEARGPMIEPDASGRRLLIRGTADQIAQVKILLVNLGETGLEPNNDGEVIDRGPVRQLNLGGRDPHDVLPLIRQMWEATDRNPIRVVVPSQPNPIRDRRVPGAGSIDPEAPTEPTRSGLDPRRDVQPVIRPETPGTRGTGPAAQTPRRASILQVSQSGAGERNEDDPRAITTSGARNPEGNSDEGKESGQPRNEADVSESPDAAAGKAPVSMSIVGEDIILMSPDTKALDQLEDMINTLAGAMPVRTKWTVFYLRSADATETSQMLTSLFPNSNVTSSTASSEGMFGSLTGGLSNIGRGMMNVTGLNQTLGGSNNLRIITDIRSNALFVTGPTDQIREVEYMLELLDSSERPESLRDRLPKTIPVEHADIDEVADIVESVFKSSMSSGQPQGGDGQKFNPLAMLMGGGGNSGARKEPGLELTVGIDRRTSHLIVACSDSLYRQIEGLVKSIDERARDARQTVQIMRLESADPSLVQSTLTSLIPKVTVSASRGGQQRRQRDSGQPGEQPQNGQQPPDAVRDAELLRRTMEQRSRGQSGQGDQGGGNRSPFGGRGGFSGGRSFGR